QSACTLPRLSKPCKSCTTPASWLKRSGASEHYDNEASRPFYFNLANHTGFCGRVVRKSARRRGMFVVNSLMSGHICQRVEEWAADFADRADFRCSFLVDQRKSVRACVHPRPIPIVYHRGLPTRLIE